MSITSRSYAFICACYVPANSGTRAIAFFASDPQCDPVWFPYPPDSRKGAAALGTLLQTCHNRQCPSCGASTVIMHGNLRDADGWTPTPICLRYCTGPYLAGKSSQVMGDHKDKICANDEVSLLWKSRPSSGDTRKKVILLHFWDHAYVGSWDVLWFLLCCFILLWFLFFVFHHNGHTHPPIRTSVQHRG